MGSIFSSSVVASLRLSLPVLPFLNWSSSTSLLPHSISRHLRSTFSNQSCVFSLPSFPTPLTASPGHHRSAAKHDSTAGEAHDSPRDGVLRPRLLSRHRLRLQIWLCGPGVRPGATHKWSGKKEWLVTLSAVLTGCDRLQVYRSSQPRESLCNGLPGTAPIFSKLSCRPTSLNLSHCRKVQWLAVSMLWTARQM